MGLWARVFAAAYDPILARAERAGIARSRRALLRTAAGRVLEIGTGTGLNAPHYPPGADVTYTEPDAHMRKQLARKGIDAVAASAAALPFEDDTFDTVVSTFVLCTVPDPAAALREARRVLRPGGQLLFLEHVRAARGSRLERWQDRLHGPWHALAGCHCNRDLVSLVTPAGFQSMDVMPEEWRFMPPIVRPVVRVAAR